MPWIKFKHITHGVPTVCGFLQKSVSHRETLLVSKDVKVPGTDWATSTAQYYYFQF